MTPVAAPALVDLDADGVAVGAHLDAVGERVGQVGDQRRRLGVDLAALQAEAAVDAVRAVAEYAVGDRHRPDAHLDAGLARAGAGAIGAAGHRVRRVRVAVWVAPRPVLAGDRQLGLDALVVGPELAVGDRPVGADPVAAARRRSPTGESAACSRRSGPSIRRRRGRSCSCRARRGPRRRSGGWPSSRACRCPPRRTPSRCPGPRTGPTRGRRSASRGGRGAARACCRRRPRRRSAGRPRRPRGRTPSCRARAGRAGVRRAGTASRSRRVRPRPWPAA